MCFFFQAEDGIRDGTVTGVQTCALPILENSSGALRALYADLHVHSDDTVGTNDTSYNLSYGRDVAGLDVLGYKIGRASCRERWRSRGRPSEYKDIMRTTMLTTCAQHQHT